MKLMNFRRLDPRYTSDGKTGLSRGAKAAEEVWTEFAGDAERCERVAAAIVASLDAREVNAAWSAWSDLDEYVEEAPEGRLLTRQHVARERNRKLVKSKRDQCMHRQGK